MCKVSNILAALACSSKGVSKVSGTMQGKIKMTTKRIVQIESIRIVKTMYLVYSFLSIKECFFLWCLVMIVGS